ncbi:MAG TPA: patatin-like phospholipase family protein [Solirubrobacteraceae bacterium]|nr:patatin-like phospholipase family protein [Solirubrobacteraceae bacterium]
MGPDPDIYNIKHGFERLDVAGRQLRNALDLQLLRHARRALLPLPLIDQPRRPPGDVFPPFRRRPAVALGQKRVAVVASGGGGAAVATIGAVRAFEEAGVQPELICGCSGGGLFSSLWAAGLSAQEMADFVLAWEPERYLDPQWLRLPRFVLTALRGFSGVMKGEAVEDLINGRFGSLAVGELPIPLATIVYNTDLGLIEYLGTHTTPDVPLGRVVRITIALPPFIEAVDVHGHLYVDGGVVELLPIQPVLDHGPFDHVFGLNFMLPERLTPDDITGWQSKPMGIVQATRELQQAYHVEFARRAKRELGGALTIIDAADPRLCRGGWLMDLFIDRSRWPELIRTGYERTRAALAPLRRQPRRSVEGAIAGSAAAR